MRMRAGSAWWNAKYAYPSADAVGSSKEKSVPSNACLKDGSICVCEEHQSISIIKVPTIRCHVMYTASNGGGMQREREREAERERDVLCHARLFSIFTNTLNVKYAKKIKQSWSASQLLHLAAKVHQRQQRDGKPDRTLATDRSLFARAGRFGNARPIVPLTLCGVSPSFARTRWNCWLPMFALMMFTWRLDRVDHKK